MDDGRRPMNYSKHEQWARRRGTCVRESARWVACCNCSSGPARPAPPCAVQCSTYWFAGRGSLSADQSRGVVAEMDGDDPGRGQRVSRAFQAVRPVPTGLPGCSTRSRRPRTRPPRGRRGWSSNAPRPFRPRWFADRAVRFSASGGAHAEQCRAWRRSNRSRSRGRTSPSCRRCGDGLRRSSRRCRIPVASHSPWLARASPRRARASSS